MKFIKLLLAFSLILGIFAAVVSCGGSSGTDNETAEESEEEASTETKKSVIERETLPPETEKEQNGGELKAGYEEIPFDTSKYFTYKEFEIPTGDLREEAVAYMRKESEVVWKCKKTFRTTENFVDDGWGINLTYEGGKEYRGLPYANTYVMLPEFERFLDNNRAYTTDSTEWIKTPGVQCCSSITASLQRFSDVYGYSTSFCPVHDDFIALKVGEYDTAGMKTTEEVVKKNGPKTILEAYSNMQKGDVIYKGPGAAHLRLIEENSLSRKSDGSVNDGRSYVITIEQTNTIDNTRKDGVNTTWWVDHKYTYGDLLGTYYLPVTIKEYTEPKKSNFFIGLTKEITSQDLSDEYLPGSVETNSVMRYVYLELLDQSGKVVSSVVRHNLQDSNSSVLGSSSRKIDLRALAAPLFKDIPAGNYTFVLTAGIPIGEAELVKVDFTYKK